MTSDSAADSTVSQRTPGQALNERATPAYERVLGLFEKAPPDTPFESAHVAVLMQLQKAARDHYLKTLNQILESRDAEDRLSLADIRGAQMLNRRIANAFAETVQRLVPVPDSPDAGSIPELALYSLRARAEEIKWQAFEQTRPPRSSWQHTNALMLALEALGVERQASPGEITPTDAFAHCLLLATLNVGMLSAPQVELAHRWLAQSARDVRLEPFFDPEAHWYQIDLAQAAGPLRVSPGATATATTRFVVVSGLGTRLGHARAQLYAGKLAVGATPNHIAALHFGAFLDLAERLWSLDWRRSSWRDDREPATGGRIEVVLGFDLARAALDNEADDDVPPPPTVNWLLRDKSKSGLGAVLPDVLGAQIPVGALIGFRGSADDEWELGTVVRRIKSADETEWAVGIKRLSDSPVALMLKAYAEGPSLEQEIAPGVASIYAPINAETGRVDGLIVSATAYGKSAEYFLPARGGAFRIRANRVIDRGDQWVRFGFEVLGKK
jgi:hypothetical protein